MLKAFRLVVRPLAAVLVLASWLLIPIQAQTKSQSNNSVARPILLQILQAEDERRWDKELEALLTHDDAAVRKRAFLAAGRIGDERAVSIIIAQMDKETDSSARAMAVFALGEIESTAATEVLIKALESRDSPLVRARAVEALGKIVAAAPKPEETQPAAAKKAIIGVLEFEAGRRSAPDEEAILLALTAALRARPDGAGKVIAEFLTYGDSRIRADAANALARLRAKDGNEQLRKMLNSDSDPIVRANAARVLGATEDKESMQSLLEALEEDEDERVRVSALRAFVSLKPDTKPAIERFLKHAHCQRSLELKGKLLVHVRHDYECMDMLTALGRLFQGTGNDDAFSRIWFWSWDFRILPPEMEVALARIDPERYLKELRYESGKKGIPGRSIDGWQDLSSLAQGLGEFASLTTEDKKDLRKRAQELLNGFLNHENANSSLNTLIEVHPEYAIPDVLRAYTAFKSPDGPSLLRKHLQHSDAVVRATAAELLGDLPADEENSRALIAALPVALNDKQLNDASLAIVDALAKQKSTIAYEALKDGLKSSDHLIRRRVASALKANDAGDFFAQVGLVQSRNRLSDYKRALARANKRVLANIKTTRGVFTIELLPAEAPLTVDNFVQLAKRGYFNRILFHRVVPNFVIQSGDPRGDGNGGPGYSIRCEINMTSYDRGAVGMALSGKDTGGSQWFVTHSPQPHLDGGYTVFGNVIEGMNVVDSIARGDAILSVNITEQPRSRMRRQGRN